MSKYEHLLSPLTLRGKTLKNRQKHARFRMQRLRLRMRFLPQIPLPTASSAYLQHLPTVAVILWMIVLERYIYKPIRELVTYIVNADENGRNSRPDKKYFKEIRVIFDAFDRKMQENRNLKIEAYEYTLREQQAKLEYLQIQIRPHFIVNGLNSICAMIDMKRADGAREMSMYLAQYLQSLYQKNAGIKN